MVDETEPRHRNPDLGIGDIYRYSGLFAQVISELATIHNLPVGQGEMLPPIKSWLPDGRSYLFEIKVTPEP